MQRFWISVMGALLSMSLITAAAGTSTPAKVATPAKAAATAKAAPLTRTERCTDLNRQVDEALETHAAATQVTAAKALQRKGNRFCAAKKQAQGIRMLANALKLLGVTPIDPVQ